MKQIEVEELAEIINTLPNYTEEQYGSKYLIIANTAQWLDQKGVDTNRFYEICWYGGNIWRVAKHSLSLHTPM